MPYLSKIGVGNKSVIKTKITLKRLYATFMKEKCELIAYDMRYGNREFTVFELLFTIE
jgi:hypothetical protein